MRPVIWRGSRIRSPSEADLEIKISRSVLAYHMRQRALDKYVIERRKYRVNVNALHEYNKFLVTIVYMIVKTRKRRKRRGAI